MEDELAQRVPVRFQKMTGWGFPGSQKGVVHRDHQKTGLVVEALMVEMELMMEALVVEV